MASKEDKELDEYLNKIIAHFSEVDSDFEGKYNAEELKALTLEKIRSYHNQVDSKMKRMRRRIFVYLSIALSLLAINIGVIYTLSSAKEVQVLTKEPQAVTLNGLFFNLNADTKLSYKKGWWSNVRELRLHEGELFINNPGNSYLEIISNDAVVSVLNGNVNVYSRNGYHKVSSQNGEVIYTKDSLKLFINKEHELRIKSNGPVLRRLNNPLNIGLYRSSFFYFEEESLSTVLDEFQRVFRIKLVYDSDFRSEILVSGLFSYFEDVDVLLRKVLPPEYSVVRKSDDEYLISKYPL